MLNNPKQNATSVQVFNNEQFGEVRVAVNETGEPIFCLADLCKVLDLTATKVSQRLSDDVLSKHPIVDSLGRKQQASFVNEDGMYDVVLDSRKPEARVFRKWITSEVLPSLRKNGKYELKNHEKLSGLYIHVTGADGNMYMFSILKAIREFIGEEVKGNIFTELRLSSKIDAARKLFPEDKRSLRTVNAKVLPV